MKANVTRLRARVENGRLVMDLPTDLPEGTVFDLVVDDGDELDDEERKALHSAIDESLRQAASGRTHPASKIVDEIRRHGKG